MHSETSVLALAAGIVESRDAAAPEPQRQQRSRRFEPSQSEQNPSEPIAPGIGHNLGPPLLAPDDVLDGGAQIHTFVCALLGRKQSLATTYYQIARGIIPAHRMGTRLIGSKRGIAQHFAIGTGLVA